jgi:hypothetical protein
LFYLIFLAQAGIFCFYKMLKEIKASQEDVFKAFYGNGYHKEHVRPVFETVTAEAFKEEEFGFGSEGLWSLPPNHITEQIPGEISLNGRKFNVDRQLLGKLSTRTRIIGASINQSLVQELSFGGGQFSRMWGVALAYMGTPMITSNMSQEHIDALLNTYSDFFLKDQTCTLEEMLKSAGVSKIQTMEVPLINLLDVNGQIFSLRPASQVVTTVNAKPIQLLNINDITAGPLDGEESDAEVYKKYEKSTERKTTKELAAIARVTGNISRYHNVFVWSRTAQKYETKGSSLSLD